VVPGEGGCDGASGAAHCHWRGPVPFSLPAHCTCVQKPAHFYLPLVLVGPPALSRGLLPPQSPTRPLPGQRPDEPMSLTLRLTNFPRSTCWNWGRGCDQARKRSKQAPAAAVRVKGPALPQGACLDRPRQLALHTRGLGMLFSPGRKIWCDLMRRRTVQGKAGSRERSADCTACVPILSHASGGWRLLVAGPSSWRVDSRETGPMSAPLQQPLFALQQHETLWPACFF
jgi:hypothetical protein